MEKIKENPLFFQLLSFLFFISISALPSLISTPDTKIQILYLYNIPLMADKVKKITCYSTQSMLW